MRSRGTTSPAVARGTGRDDLASGSVMAHARVDDGGDRESGRLGMPLGRLGTSTCKSRVSVGE